MPKKKSESFDVHVQKVIIRPDHLMEADDRRVMRFPHKIIVVVRQDLAQTLYVSTRCGGFHEWMMEDFKRLEFKGAKVFGARIGLKKIDANTHDLLINDGSATYTDITEDMGMTVCAKISQLLKARRKRPKERRYWKRIPDWQYVGTKLEPSNQQQI